MVESMLVLVIKWKFFVLLETSFSPWVAGIENWVITDIFVLLVCFWNITGQVSYPGGICDYLDAVVLLHAAPYRYLHTPILAGE